jgi:small-conductance mechanosensitive channel
VAVQPVTALREVVPQSPDRLTDLFDADVWLSGLSLGEVGKIVAILALVAIFYLVRALLRKRAERSIDNLLMQLFGAVNWPVQSLFLLTAAMLATQLVAPGLAAATWFGHSYRLGIVALATWLLISLVGFASARYLRRFDVTQSDNLRARMHHTQVMVVRRVVIALIVILATASALMMFEGIRALGVSLLASAGIAGLVVGLAAQKTIGNFIMGLQIAFTQPIRLDDAVVVEGEWGWVEEINLTYVVVRIWDKRRLVLPVSYFLERPFQNWTRTSADILGPVVLHLDYRTPLDAMRAELNRFLEGNDLWDGVVKVVQVTDTTERNIVVRILVSAADSGRAWDLRCAVREHMVDFLAREHPYALPRLRASVDDEEEPAIEPADHASA